MPIPGNLLTTAMAVMPHTDVTAALDAALSLDIPFRPQLPRLNHYEDMYVQASEHFPGIVLDMDKQTLAFDFAVHIKTISQTQQLRRPVKSEVGEFIYDTLFSKHIQ